MRCAIFQINTKLLITERNIRIFTRQTLYPSFISKKKLTLSIGNILPSIHSPSPPPPAPPSHFHYFWQWVRFVIIQIRTDFLINQLQKYFYTKQLKLLLYSNKKIVLSIAESFRKIDFLPHFYQISRRWGVKYFK